MARSIRSFVGNFTSAKALLVMSIAAFMTRLLPLSMSQYPFNNDSLSECTLATRVLSSGHLDLAAGAAWYETHSGATPVLNVLLAFVSSVFGTTPFQCAQILDAVVAVLTVGCVFLLGRLVSGSLRGGIAASFSAVLMGTFVFTTGSAWKEMLGIALLVFALLSYVRRSRIEFRVLAFTILMLLPLVHHLVALVALLAFAYLLSWSWFFAFSNGLPKRRHVEDLVLVVTPIIWAVVYYSLISFDRISLVSSPIKLVLFGASFVLISMIAIMVLSMRRHSKWTFAPFVGGGFFILVILDYLGFLFSYSPSVSQLYLLLVVSSGFLLGLAWYGTEVIVETRPVYRAVQIALIVSPLSILGYGILSGFSSVSHQIVYRTVDFADIFIFIGIGTAVVWLYQRRRRAYHIVGFLTVVLLLASFPFGYESGELLGVRHDTQAYEVDAIRWLSVHHDSPFLESDERLGHIANGTVGLGKHSALPSALLYNTTIDIIPEISTCLMEDSWTSEGVNNFPYGKVVLAPSNYTWALESSNVFYIGGPSTDRAVMFIRSGVGWWYVYMHESPP